MELTKQKDKYKNIIKILKQELLLIFSNYGDILLEEIDDREKLGNLAKEKDLKLKIFFSFVKYFGKKLMNILLII